MGCVQCHASCHKYAMQEVTYKITQDPKSPLVFYLTANVMTLYQGADLYAQDLIRSRHINSDDRIRLMMDWFGHKARLVLNTHEIGRWLRACGDRVIYKGDRVQTDNKITLVFLDPDDAMLFKMTFK